MIKSFFFFLVLVISINVSAQRQVKGLRSFLNEAGIRPTKVMLVGTFHFAYQNLDMHKTEEKNQRDILSAKSQKELQQVLDVIRAYKPTRICLEAKDQKWLDSCYDACSDSTFATQRNERVQIGFRLAKELKLSKVYSVDATELINDFYDADSTLLFKTLGSDSVADKTHADLINRTYSNYYSYLDSFCAKASLLDAFLLLNDPVNLRLSHGAYLSGYFNTRSNYGPDFLATWWIDRNLRVFNNVLLTKPSGDDRILILFGSGHIPLLEHNFGSSPDFEIVDFYKAALKFKK